MDEDTADGLTHLWGVLLADSDTPIPGQPPPFVLNRSLTREAEVEVEEETGKEEDPHRERTVGRSETADTRSRSISDERPVAISKYVPVYVCSWSHVWYLLVSRCDWGACVRIRHVYVCPPDQVECVGGAPRFGRSPRDGGGRDAHSSTWH